MSETFDIAPELRELLGEIASDEGARLLRLNPRQVQVVLYERDAKARASAPFLGNAERKLLEAYREESARILHLYAELLRAENPPDPFHHTGDCVTPVPEASSVKNRARRVVQDPRFAIFDEETRRILDHCIAGPHPRTTAAVAAASVRISPNLKARVSLAVDRIGANPTESRTAQALSQLIEGSSHPVLASYGFESLAWRAHKLGDHSGAIEGCKRAVDCMETRVVPVLSWMVSSIQAERESETIDAMLRIDTSLQPEHVAVTWFAARLARSRAGQNLDRDSRFVRPVLRLMDRAGATSRRILRELV